MKLNKKGLTNEEIQELIDEHVKWSKFYNEVVLPVYIQSEVARIMFQALRESGILNKKWQIKGK